MTQATWSIWLLVRLVSGTLLAAAMVIVGLLAATWVSDLWPALRWPLILGGASLYCGGLLMFVGAVANRLFPHADQALCGAVEWASGALFAVLAVAAVVVAAVAGR